MSKIICDICGTAYPETASQCPICGCERPENAEFDTGAVGETGVESAAAQPAVKGGRFSKSNVKKRNSAKGTKKTSGSGKSGKSKKNSTDRVLAIIAVILALAIVAVVGYLYFNFFAPSGNNNDTPGTNPPQTTTAGTPTTQAPAPSTTETTADTTPPETTPPTTTQPEVIPCTGLSLAEDTVLIYQSGATWILSVAPTPANTTDEMIFATTDDTVATVSADGKITAVGDGTADIVITCGDISVVCKVFCDLQPEPTETEPEDTQPEETQPQETQGEADPAFKLRKEDITFDAKGQTYQLYKGDLDVKDIKWTVNRSSVATVKDGVVTAVGPGITTVTAEYNGVKLTCIVRCDF